METNGGNHKTITHDFPIWRDKANFILAARLTEPDVPEGWKWEQIWARQIEDNIFEVCCIPFVTYGLALGDLVDTRPLEERTYVIDKIVEKKGHTTYRIWFSDIRQWQSVIEAIKDLGCLVEIRWANSKLVSVDVSTVEIRKALETYLSKLETSGALTFEIAI